MADLTRTLQDLRQERDRAQREVGQLDEAISVLEGVTGRNRAGRPARGGRTAGTRRPRRRMSAAGRRKIAVAQRARWAKQKAAKSGRTQARKGPRHMSAAARNRIARAQRIRWAKLKAEKKTAARAPKKPVQKAQAKAA